MATKIKNNEAAMNQMASLIASLEDCVEIMERVHPDGLPVDMGTLCEEQDWAKALFLAKRTLATVESMAWNQ